MRYFSKTFGIQSHRVPDVWSNFTL